MGEQNKKSADNISQLFKGIWTLEYIDTDLEVEEVVKKAIDNPQNYVMKP